MGKALISAYARLVHKRTEIPETAPHKVDFYKRLPDLERRWLAPLISVFRKEVKFPMAVQDFCRLRPRLSAVMEKDRNGTDFGYVVRSLYFDSVYDRDYYDTVDGLQSKGKIRLRTYAPGREIKLELKRKEGADSLKYSLDLTKDEAMYMQEGDYTFLTQRPEEVAQRIFIQLTQGGYTARSLVEYDREAYVYPYGDVRITFDSGTRATASAWDLFSENPPFTPVVPWGTGVLEVKYSSMLPSVVRGILDTEFLPGANSKYVQSRQFYEIGGDLR